MSVWDIVKYIVALAVMTVMTVLMLVPVYILGTHMYDNPTCVTVGAFIMGLIITITVGGLVYMWVFSKVEDWLSR